MAKGSNELYNTVKRAWAVTVCVVEMSIVATGVTACGINDNNTAMLQGTGGTQEAQQAESVPEQTQQSAQPAKQGADGQIDLEEAKQAAIADAQVSASDVIYTKEKLDYEDGIAVYDVEFYVDNVEYEYEINAVTGDVYSKSVEMHQRQDKDANNGQAEASDTLYINDESAKMIALDHAGFSEADVSYVKTEFDIDDGLAEYEVEFYKDGKEYEYKINAADGSILEYDVD